MHLQAWGDTNLHQTSCHGLSPSCTSTADQVGTAELHVMGWFGGSSDNAAEVPKEQPGKPKKKICCACPDTKVWRGAIMRLQKNLLTTLSLTLVELFPVM